MRVSLKGDYYNVNSLNCTNKHMKRFTIQMVSFMNLSSVYINFTLDDPVLLVSLKKMSQKKLPAIPLQTYARGWFEP